MPDSQHAAVRRNFVITSSAFIIYYAGDGQIDGNILRLPMLNISFHQPQVLHYLAYVILLWTAYRFWQLHRGLFMSELDRELSRPAVPWIALRLFKNQLAREYDLSTHRLEYISIEKIDGGLTISCRVNFPRIDGRRPENKKLALTGWKKNSILTLIRLNNVLTLPGATEYVLPWLLFAAAITGCYWGNCTP